MVVFLEIEKKERKAGKICSAYLFFVISVLWNFSELSLLYTKGIIVFVCVLIFQDPNMKEDPQEAFLCVCACVQHSSAVG